MTSYEVSVDVATGWTAPDAPRPVDGPAVADRPDVAAWIEAMDDADHRGLHGRTLTQLLEHEPVEIVADRGDWVRVVALWQPAPEDPRGYPAWVRRSHLAPVGTRRTHGPAQTIDATVEAVLEAAGAFVGLRYVWGGTSPAGFDCSGLVHYAYRRAGVVVPRDAHAQAAAVSPVGLGDERRGDLYFFATDGPISHVGFVTGAGTMLHAPAIGGHIEDAPLATDRRHDLVCAGRVTLGRSG